MNKTHTYGTSSRACGRLRTDSALTELWPTGLDITERLATGDLSAAYHGSPGWLQVVGRDDWRWRRTSAGRHDILEHRNDRFVQWFYPNQRLGHAQFGRTSSIRCWHRADTFGRRGLIRVRWQTPLKGPSPTDLNGPLEKHSATKRRRPPEGQQR